MPGQARLGDKGQALTDTHGCPTCPHPTLGPAIAGSPSVNINGRPAIRVGDVGIHAACCGSNMWTAQLGSATVFINQKKAHRLNDGQRHCGGAGKMIEGSPDVIVGDGGGGGGGGGASPTASGLGAASARSQAGGAPATAASTAGAGSAAPASAAPESPVSIEPAPVVFSARWEKPTGRFSSAIKLLASCANAAGKPATFTIRDADDPAGAPLATVSATCGADTVEARWTVHDGPEPQELVFEVGIDGSSARSGTHVLLVTAEGTLTIEGKPAGGVDLVLTTAAGEERKVKTDAGGAWKVEDVPAGDYTIRLVVEEGALE